MRDRDDERTSALATAIMARATYLKIAADADEVAALACVLTDLPLIGDSDLTEREHGLVRLLRLKSDAAKRLLVLLVGDANSQWL